VTILRRQDGTVKGTTLDEATLAKLIEKNQPAK